MIRLVIFSLSVVFLFTNYPIYSQKSPHIVLFSPQGIIKEPNQIHVRFSEAMVPMGDPRVNTDIFESNCNSLGKSRWIDGNNWVMDLKNPLEAGKECVFQLKESVKSLKKESIAGVKKYLFSTGGVTVQYSTPWIEGVVTEDQIFLFKLDGEVDQNSLVKKLFLIKDGTSDRVGFNLIQGNRKSELVKLAYWEGYDDRLVVALSPKTLLPNSSKIQLVWSREIQSKDGLKNDLDQILSYSVRSKFQASLYCQRESKGRHCIPLTDIELNFSAPIASSELPFIYLQDALGKKIFTKNLSEYEKSNSIEKIIFSAPFPENSKFKLFLPSSIQDDSNRPLSNIESFPMEVTTDRYTPLAKFSSSFGVLESKSSPILPVTLRNLEGTVTGKILSIKPSDIQGKSLSKWMSLVHNNDNKISIFKNQSEKTIELQVPKIMQDGSMEVVGIPLLKPGFYAVELKSRILGQSLIDKNQDFFVPTAVLVTNLGIHFKLGRESSLVWVTELSTGKPVANVNVSIVDCNGKIFSKGKTQSNGLYEVSRLPDKSEFPSCSWKLYENGIFVIATLDGDTSFLHSNWNKGIESWRFNLPDSNYKEGEIVHSFLDRTLFRAGETVSLKNTIRKHSMRGFISPDLSKIPTLVMIKHEGSETTYYKPIQWVFPGSSSLEWKIPKNAFLGTYSIHLATSEDDNWGVQKLGEFRVEEFRLPILRASISSPKLTWIDEEIIPITLQASFLAGGQASGLPVSFRYKITPDTFKPKGWDNFTFSSPPIKTGKLDSNSDQSQKGYETIKLNLNQDGLASTSVKWKDRKEVSIMNLEMEFHDPNGETQSVSSKIQLLPSTQFVGLSMDSDSWKKDNIKMNTVVINSLGNPIPNVPVEIHAYLKNEYYHRKRLVGGFYSYDNYTEVEGLGKICDGRTDSKGYFQCVPKNFSRSGDIVFEARSKDSKGGVSYANRTVWIVDKNDWWYSSSDSDRMDLIPDKNRYIGGDIAKIKVEAPYSDYTALITVEREGVMRSYVREMKGSDPFVSIPIEKEFAPNAFVSILAIRGRVGSPKETSLVDLSRPSFRMGIKEIKVGWHPYELKVDIKPDKKEYQVRSNVQVRFSVTNANKKVNGGELAIAIVDESLLELYQNTTSDILDTMMGTRGLNVDSYTLQMQVVGKRHFGKKAVPIGGGGGNQPTRELFDTLLYWNPEVRLNGNGEASIQFKLKDSLTSYKIIAVATSGTELFGSGDAKFTSTQDILLFSGLPPVVRTGDRFIQEFTIKNNSKEAKSLTLTLTADGTNGIENFLDQKLTIDQGESKKINWEALVGGKSGIRNVVVQLKSDGKLIDSLKITQMIEDSIPVRTIQGTVLRLDNNTLHIPISMPKDGIYGRDFVNLSLAGTILSSTKGIQSYMSSYPFTCIEQKFSKAIVSEDKLEKDAVLNELSSYMDPDGLVKYFPNSNWGDEVLSATLLVLANEARWTIPNSLLDKIKSGLNRYLDGTLIRHRQYNYNDSLVRRILIMDALSRYDAIGSRISGLDIDVSILPNSTLLQWIGILQRDTSLTSRNELLNLAVTNLRGRLNFQGGELVLRDNQGDIWWLMGNSDLDSARFLSYAIENTDYKSEMARLALGFTARMKKGRFSTTLSNSFGYLAMKKFSEIIEKEKVSGVTEVKLNNMERKYNWENLNDKRVVSTNQFPMNQSKDGNVIIKHVGSGQPWVFVSTESAIPLKENIDHGIVIRKEIKPIFQKSSGKWSVGDIANVRLNWKISATRTWVVLMDPIPTGSSIIGSGLGRDSGSVSKSYTDSSYYLSFQERGFSNFKAYFEFLPEGSYSLDYNLRINQEGNFALPPTRAEAMYSPDIFGETSNQEWIVLP